MSREFFMILANQKQLDEDFEIIPESISEARALLIEGAGVLFNVGIDDSLERAWVKFFNEDGSASFAGQVMIEDYGSKEAAIHEITKEILKRNTPMKINWL